MFTNHEELYSRAASDGAAPYFPRSAGPAPLVTESGLPDPRTVPRGELARLYAAVLEEETDELHYGTPVDGELHYGLLGLRELLAERASAPGAHEVDPSGVMLTAGGVQGISLATRAFLDEGDVVAIEWPTWDFVLRDFALTGSEVLTVPLDEDGMDVDALERELLRLQQEGRRLKLVYTIPNFNVPTGACQSRDRRQRLVELAAEHGFVIVEDDVYGSLRYSGEPLPTLFDLDRAGLVVHVGSFSKTISPSLRLGWVTGHPDLVAGMARVRRDLGTSNLTARVIRRFLAEGLYEPHVEKVRAHYAAKRDATIAALHEHCAPWVQCTPPDGGYFLWLELSDELDPEVFNEYAVANGVRCRPGGRFYSRDGEGAHHMRLSFTEPPMSDMLRAAEVLGEAVRASREPSRSVPAS